MANDRRLEHCVPAEVKSSEPDDSLSLISFWVGNPSLKKETISKLTMFAYLLEDDDKVGKKFAALIDELLKVDPANMGRVMAYLTQLNLNLAEKKSADPREYAKKVMRGNRDPK